MRGKNLIWASLLTVLVLATGIVGIVVAPATTKVSVNPSSLGNVAAGSQLVVDIRVDNVIGLSGWEMRLQWDPFVLKPVSVVEGPFLSSVGATLFASSISPFGESVLAGAALMVVSTASGDGVLATVTLEAIGAGSTAVDLVLSDLRDVNVQAIDHNVFGSSANVHIGVEAESASPEKSPWSMSEDTDITNNGTVILSAEVRNHGGVDAYAQVVFSGKTMGGLPLRYATSTELVPAHGTITLQTDEFNATTLGPGVYRFSTRAFWGYTAADYYGAKVKALRLEVRE